MLAKADTITSCYIGPKISPEQFVQEHFFLFLLKGTMAGYDGHKHYSLIPGECCIVRKNHLARYNKQKVNDEFEKVVVIFDEGFLKSFAARHAIAESSSDSKNAFIKIADSELITNFVRSLSPYYTSGGQIDETFSAVKREELLLILLRLNPDFKGVFFDFGVPEKTNLEEYMNRNYKFNVGIDRFAYLTGRSLTVFKKEFESIFKDTPGRWLVKRRLQEAHFQIHHEGKKASDIYVDLGFEDLSHFSFAFKKMFGSGPSKM